eukprot:810942-Rhodomonas_salina.1
MARGCALRGTEAACGPTRSVQAAALRREALSARGDDQRRGEGSHCRGLRARGCAGSPPPLPRAPCPRHHPPGT